MRYFMNEINKAVSSQLTLQMFRTFSSHVREHKHVYRLYYRLPNCTRNPCKVLDYMNNSFMNFVNCCKSHEPHVEVVYCK